MPRWTTSSPGPTPATSPMPSWRWSKRTPSKTRSTAMSSPTAAPTRTGVHVSHPRILVATAGRVLRQLRHDPRTIGLLIVAPVGLIGLLAWVLSGQPGVFDEWGTLLLGIFPLLVMFLVT